MIFKLNYALRSGLSANSLPSLTPAIHPRGVLEIVPRARNPRPSWLCGTPSAILIHLGSCRTNHIEVASRACQFGLSHVGTCHLATRCYSEGLRYSRTMELVLAD